MPLKGVFFILIFLLAFLIRLDLLMASNFRIDSDEAIVGLMARHILAGQPLPTFYYGQNYMGSFEALVAAGAFSLFGTSIIVLKSVPLAFSLLFLLLVFQLARSLFSSRAAYFALLLGALPPSTLVIWSAKARGGFIEVMCIGAIAMLAFLGWVRNAHKRSFYTIAIGFTLGFGWWVNNQIIYFMLPIGLLMLMVSIQERFSFFEILGNLFFGLSSFFVGGAPYWLYNFKNNFVSLEMFRTAGNSENIGKHIAGLFQTALPILLGGKRFWHLSDLFWGSSVLAGVLFIVCLLIYFWARWRDVLGLLLFRVDRKNPRELILLFFLATLAVFISSSFGYLSEAPRYLLPLYVGILLIMGQALDLLWCKRPFFAGILFGLILSVNLLSEFYGSRAVPGEPFVFDQQRVSKDHFELIGWLKKNSFPWVRTNYWIGYRLAFETEEQVKFLIFGEPHQTRIEKYEQEGLRYGREKMPLVLVPAQADYVKLALQAQGFFFKEVLLSGYLVLYDILPSQKSLKLIADNLLAVTVSDRPEFAELAIDDQIATRWRSARPQSPDMELDIRFAQPLDLKAIKYEMGAWPHDYPRGLDIFVVAADGQETRLYKPEAYEAIRYYLHGDSQLSFYHQFKQVVGVRFLQTGSHPVFDWSVAEMHFYQ